MPDRIDLSFIAMQLCVKGYRVSVVLFGMSPNAWTL